MKFNPTKLMAFTCAVALGFSGSKTVTAQDTVIATLTTAAGITTTDGVDMDFGTWSVQIDPATASDQAIFVLDADTGAVTTGTSTLVSGSSQLVNISTASVQAGTVLVQTPAPSTLQMTRTASSAFGDLNLSVTSVTYSTAAQTQVALVPAVAAPVTVAAGGINETVSFGATILAVDTPTPSTAHTSSFDVTFTF